MTLPAVDEDLECVCGGRIDPETDLCDTCDAESEEEEEEEEEEDYEGEARLQRWERAREEWWA